MVNKFANSRENEENREGNATFLKVFLFAPDNRWDWLQFKQNMHFDKLRGLKI